MTTYKRVTYCVVLPVDPNQTLDYLFNGLPVLLSQGGWAASVVDPLQPVGTVRQGAVADHRLSADGITGIRCSFDTHGIALPAGSASDPYTLTLLGSGGIGPYTFELHSGTLPSGLTLSAGVISGTPDTAASFNFNIRVYDVMGRWYNEDFTITIDP